MTQRGRAVIDKLHDALQAPFNAGGHSLSSEANIGMSMFPEDGTDEARLYAVADQRMYEHKLVARKTGDGEQHARAEGAVACDSGAPG